MLENSGEKTEPFLQVLQEPPLCFQKNRFLELRTFCATMFFNNFLQGLYPESHGIISNKFFDERLKDTFRIGPPASFEKKWWGGEPVG